MVSIVTPFSITSDDRLLAQLEQEPANVRFNPRVNIQDAKGGAKPYQVRQVLAAIAKLQGETE